MISQEFPIILPSFFFSADLNGEEYIVLNMPLKTFLIEQKKKSILISLFSDLNVPVNFLI